MFVFVLFGKKSARIRKNPFQQLEKIKYSVYIFPFLFSLVM